MSKFIHSPEDQIDIINHLHVYLQSNQHFEPFFPCDPSTIVQIGCIEDEAILEWYEEEKEKRRRGGYLYCRQD